MAVSPYATASCGDDFGTPAKNQPSPLQCAAAIWTRVQYKWYNHYTQTVIKFWNKKNRTNKTVVFRSTMRIRGFGGANFGPSAAVTHTHDKGRSGPGRGRRACSCGTVGCQSVGRIVVAVLQHIYATLCVAHYI